MIDFDDSFALNPATNDWDLVSGVDAAQQRLESRLGTNQGEWGFDLTFGVPWLSQILGELGESASLRQIIASRITADPEVASISAFDAVFDDEARRMRYTVRVRLRSGDEAQVTV